MEREQFERLVQDALEGLPDELKRYIDNVDVVVQEFPTSAQVRAGGVRLRWHILGLYEGIPRTARTSSYNMVLPDRITIFQKPIEAICRTEEEIVRQVRKTVVHEVAHHFGISDERLRELGG